MPEESATPDLVERVRQMVEVDSFTEWETLAEQLYAPNVVWNMGELLHGPLEGIAAVRAFIREYWLTWEDHHHTVEEIGDLGHGVLFAVIAEGGRIQGSDSRVHARHGDLLEFAQGKIVRRTVFTDIDEGRAAAERLAEERG